MALPDETTVAAGASWGAGWTDLGFTAAPLAVAINRETVDMEVEQIANIVKQIVTKDTVDMETVLAEITAANLRYAMSASSAVATVAAGAAKTHPRHAEIWRGHPVARVPGRLRSRAPGCVQQQVDHVVLTRTGSLCRWAESWSFPRKPRPAFRSRSRRWLRRPTRLVNRLASSRM